MSDPHKQTFREQLKASNQKFKDEMQVNNTKFKTDIHNPKPLTDKDKRFFKNFGIILLLIFLFPVGLFVMFKKSGWSKKSKTISTTVVAAFVTLMAIGIINAPPTATLDNIKPDNNHAVAGATYKLTGSVAPSGSLITINGVSVETDSQGKFSYSVPLQEGDNDITVITKNDDKQSTSVYKIHRYTKAEVIAQEKATAKKEADATAAAAKKKADEDAAAQAKQQQAADAKAKARP